MIPLAFGLPLFYNQWLPDHKQVRDDNGAKDTDNIRLRCFRTEFTGLSIALPRIPARHFDYTLIFIKINNIKKPDNICLVYITFSVYECIILCAFDFDIPVSFSISLYVLPLSFNSLIIFLSRSFFVGATTH